jgi:hypothetical protein
MWGMARIAQDSRQNIPELAVQTIYLSLTTDFFGLGDMIEQRL